MDGIHYVTDARSRRVAVQIDLDKHGDIWEDILDVRVADERNEGKKIGLDELKQNLRDVDHL